MASSKLYSQNPVDESFKPIIRLIRNSYETDMFLSQLILSKKRAYFEEDGYSTVPDGDFFHGNAEVFNKNLMVVLRRPGVSPHIPPSKDAVIFNSVLDGTIKEHDKSFKQDLDLLRNGIPIGKRDALSELVTEETQKYKRARLESPREDVNIEGKDSRYISSVSQSMKCFFSPISSSLMDYMFIFMLHNDISRGNDNNSSTLDVTRDDKSRMKCQAEYFKKNRQMAAYCLWSTSIDDEWRKRFISALTLHFFFLVIKPTLPSWHPMYQHSLDLAKSFVNSLRPANVEVDLLTHLTRNSVQMAEPLKKINDHEIDRLLCIITEFTNNTHQIDSLGDISFTFEYSASAAVLISQDRPSELFDLYKTSTGAFGSGLTSPISSLMERSFHNAMKITEQQRRCINSFLHLARANFRSEIDDWNGVDADLRLLEDSDIANNCYYHELKTKRSQASTISASILAETQRIEYLLIRSFLCTTIGEFESALTPLVEASSMLSTNDFANVETRRKFQSMIETVNQSLQKHLVFFITQTNRDLTYLSNLPCLGDYFEKLNILIGTCSIKYDEEIHNFAFKHYLEALASAKKHKYSGQINEKELKNELTSLRKFLEILQERSKQLPYSLNKQVLASFIENGTKCNTIGENNQRLNPFVHQYHQISRLNISIYPSSNAQRVAANLGQQHASQTMTSADASAGSSIESDTLSSGHHPSRSWSSIGPTVQPEMRPRYNILALDGGGIRGIVEAVFLMEIERRTGKYIGQLFNCFAGTSAGAILACGMAKRRPLKAKELLRLFLGPRRFEIFRKRRLWWIQQFWTSKYLADGIEQVLQAELPTECLSSCGHHDLIIPTEISNLGPALFINQARPTANTGLYLYRPNEVNHMFTHLESCDALLSDVARCSSAAAPLFPPKKLNINTISYNFYDGGYRLNRPDHIALKWAKTIRPRDDILLLSLGNSNAAPVPMPNIHGIGDYFRHAQEMNDVVGYNDPTPHLQHELRDRYIRITPNISISVEMDATDPANLQLLWQAAWQKITEMDIDNSFNNLCIQLLNRSNYPPILEGAYPPPEEESYYPSRYMLEHSAYGNIDRLFGNEYDFHLRHRVITDKLNEFFQNHRWPAQNSLQYPKFNTYSRHRPLSIASAIGHIPAIFHYVRDMMESMGPVLNDEERNEIDVRQSNGVFKWEWNSFHYAAANGEIIAVLVLLYRRPLEMINLMTILDENVLRRMIQLLEQKTRILGMPAYTPAELANSAGNILMNEQLRLQHSEINRQLQRVTERRRNDDDFYG